MDQERLAIGRWAAYIAYDQRVSLTSIPTGTKLTKDMLDRLLQSNALNKANANDTFLDLYKQGIMNLGQIAFIAISNSPDTTECFYNKMAESRLKTLACLPLYLYNIAVQAYHDTGSAITLHAARLRKELPNNTTTRVTKVGSRRINFRGILGR